jgi:signal transduction histidine kinase/CheY-like chemotaxis protein
VSSHLRWKNSLAVPIVALLLVLAIAMLLVGYFINDRFFYDALEEREKDKANSIRFATRSIIDAEVRKLSILSNLLKADQGISAGLTRYYSAGGDIRPLKSAMDGLFWRIDTQIFLVTDVDGVVLYRANEPLRRGDSHAFWGFEEAVSGTDTVAASEGPKGWAVHAMVPLHAGNRIAGVLVLGVLFDDAFAAKISRETGARISFANLNGVMSGDGRSDAWPPDPSLIRQSLLGQVPIFRMNLEAYKATQYTPVKVVDETFCLIIETDMGVVRGMLHRNRVKLAEAGALLLAGVLLLGITFTMLLVRPVKKLEREAREVVREFTGKELALEMRGNEIDTLATANHLMVEAIRNHIAAREEAETALRQSEVQLRQAQKMETVGRLAGGVAHDFNNLLTVINGYSDVLLQRLAETDPSRREIGEIHKAGERAADLTRQLLAFSRKQVLEAKSISLNEIVSGICMMVRRLIGENIGLVTALDPDLGTVIGDPGQVEQVVLNLAVNARDAMPSGGTITISTANVDLAAPEERDGYTLPAGRYARLEVADTGCGMDEETRERMFEPFFTTKERGKGTGLGLASVYGIVKQSGGHILARSAPGRGTSFEIYLSVREENPDASKEMAAVAANPRRTAPGGENILLVEDEEMVREIMLEGLRREGYPVLAAGNALDAISLLERHSRPIDLLLTDLMMPGMNGMELARRLMSSHPAMKVLLVSGYSEEEIGKFVRKEAGTAFLQKPVTPSVLSRKVREVLDS